MSRLVSFPFLFAFWSRALEDASFHFTSPRAFGQDLQSAAALGGGVGIRRLLGALLRAFPGGQIPPDVRSWLAS